VHLVVRDHRGFIQYEICILKQTGSYEQASYAIQDMPDMVAKHYGRFLPQDKAALAAKILNRVWEAA
jgi:hypothetical protein